jgi:hypothetical protein
MWEARRLTTQWASLACYRDSFTFFMYVKFSLMFIMYHLKHGQFCLVCLPLYHIDVCCWEYVLRLLNLLYYILCFLYAIYIWYLWVFLTVLYMIFSNPRMSIYVPMLLCLSVLGVFFSIFLLCHLFWMLSSLLCFELLCDGVNCICDGGPFLFWGARIRLVVFVYLSIKCYFLFFLV